MGPLETGDLPYPIAYHWARAGDAGLSYLYRLSCLLDTYKALVKFLVLCLVSDHIESPEPDPVLDDLIRRRFLDENMQLGNWLEILREGVRFYTHRSSRRPFVAELPSFYFRPGGMTLEAKRLEHFITFRNVQAHGSRTPNEVEARGLFEVEHRELEGILESVGFLSQYLLLIPEEVSLDDPPTVTRAFPAQGPTMQGEPLPIPPFVLQTPVTRGETLLLARAGNLAEHLLLYPLLLPEYQFEEESYDLFTYEGSLRHKHDRLAISRLVYHSTRSLKSMEIAQDTQFSKAMERFTLLFSKMVGEVLRRTAGTAAAVKNHYFASQKEIIEKYAKTFLGREDVFAAVDRFMVRNRSGYLVLVGPPGQGKTACLAHLVQERGYPHHFFARDGGRDRHLLAMRSLLQQLIVKHRLPLNVPEELLEVEKAWVEALAMVTEEVILIDALDESDLEGDPGHLGVLLPSHLPPGIVFLVSSRPGPMPDALTAERIALGALTHDEVRRLLAAHGVNAVPAQVEALFRTTGGNPLFLKVQIEEILEVGAEAMTQLKLRLEDCFLARIERTTGQYGLPAVLEIIGLLAAAQTGLSAHELADLLPEVQLFTLRRILGCLGEFLMEEGRRFRFFHKRFDEFIRKEFLTRQQLDVHHRHLIAHLEPWSEKRSPYGMQYLPAHYFALGDREGLRGLLTPAFWNEKCRLQGSAVDLSMDAGTWLDAGLPADELLGRLSDLALGADVLLVRKIIRCITDLSARLPMECLRQCLNAMPVREDFWIGSEVRKAADRLQERGAPSSGSRLRIGVLNYVGHLPFFLARETGCLSEAGLDVDLLFFDGYEDRLRALIQGEVDALATTIDEVIFAFQAGMHLQIPLRLSMENADEGMVDGILVRQPLRSIRELEGLRVAIEKDSPSLFLFHRVMQSHGIDPAKVELVYFRSSDDAGAALRDSEIDAAVLWEPWLHKAQQDSGCYLMPIRGMDVVEDVLALRADRMDLLAPQVRRIASAWTATVDNLASHGDLLVSLARDRFGLGGEDYQEIATGLCYAGRSANQAFFQRPGSAFSLVRQANFTQGVLREASLIHHSMDPEIFAPWPLVKEIWG